MTDEKQVPQEGKNIINETTKTKNPKPPDENTIFQLTTAGGAQTEGTQSSEKFRVIGRHSAFRKKIETIDYDEFENKPADI